MTSSSARAAFLELMRDHPDVAGDPRRFAALLADRFEGRWRREAAVLGAAAQEGVPAALRNGRGPFAALAAPLAARLVDDRGFDAALARWAVDSWGCALGLTTGQEAAAAPPPDDLCPARAPATGAVQVVTEPASAMVELDGRPLGPAPLLAPDVAPGRHAVRCRLAGHRDQSGEFEVRPGATTTLRVRLEPAPPAPGTLQVRTVPPGAGLYVDSRYAGTTPVVVPVTASGTVLVEAVGQDGIRWREERAVVPGADEILTIDLEAEARKQRQAQEEQAARDFGLLVLLTMVIAVIASILSALLGGGSKSK